jgi:hypothetical protein
MDFDKQLDDLEARVKGLKTSVSAAANENHEQLKQRIDQAQAETERALSEANQDANAAAQQVQSQWEQARADARSRVAALKAKAKRRADQVDADFAATDADWALADAYAAIDYADWAVENARLAILDAIDARRPPTSAQLRSSDPRSKRRRARRGAPSRTLRDHEVSPMDVQPATVQPPDHLAASSTRSLPSRRQVVARVALLIGIVLVVFVGILPRVVDYDAVRAALSALSLTQLAVLVRRDGDRLRRERRPHPHPHPRAGLAAGHRCGPGGQGRRQHDPGTDGHRDAVRPLPSVGHPRGHGDSRDRVRRVLRDGVCPHPARHRDGRGHRDRARDATGGHLAVDHRPRRPRARHRC